MGSIKRPHDSEKKLVHILLMNISENSFELEQQLINLEFKVAHQEKTIDELSQALYDQQKRLDFFEKELKDLKKNLQAGEQEIRGNEKPPHY